MEPWKMETMTTTCGSLVGYICLTCQIEFSWVWVKIKLPGDRRSWSMLPLTRMVVKFRRKLLGWFLGSIRIIDGIILRVLNRPDLIRPMGLPDTCFGAETLRGSAPKSPYRTSTLIRLLYAQTTHPPSPNITHAHPSTHTYPPPPPPKATAGPPRQLTRPRLEATNPAIQHLAPAPKFNVGLVVQGVHQKRLCWLPCKPSGSDIELRRV